MGTARRHAVMVSAEVHAAIESIRHRYRATHSRVVEALLAATAEDAVHAAMERSRARQAIDRKTRAKRRRELEALIGNLGNDAFDRVLRALKREGDELPHANPSQQGFSASQIPPSD